MFVQANIIDSPVFTGWSTSQNREGIRNMCFQSQLRVYSIIVHGLREIDSRLVVAGLILPLHALFLSLPCPSSSPCVCSPTKKCKESTNMLC